MLNTHFRCGIGTVSLLLLLATAACDAVSSDDPLDFEKEISFRFEFSTVGQPAGEPLDVGSTASLDLDDVLFAEGYTRGDVISANVTSVEIERVSPVGTNLSAFGRIDLTLAASGLTSPVIASSSSLPDDRTAVLSVQSSDVTGVVTRPSFGARLTVVPADAEDFVLRGTIILDIEVEGV